jgi:hypothetical protein
MFGFFPMISDRFLPESTENWPESTGKNPTNFWCFPARSGDVPASFPQNPAGSGGRNLRPGVRKFLANVDIFGHLDKQKLSTLATSMRLIGFDPGE